jgi:adenylate cyclase
MALEIEWKFVVLRMPARPRGRGVTIDQGYFSVEGGPAVRVRRKGRETTLDVKAPASKGRRRGRPVASREFVYDVPAADAASLLRVAPFRIRKQRHVLASGLEVDVFEGRHRGLVLAEMEVKRAGRPPEPPEGWAWRDVSHDARYSNRAMAEHGLPRGAPRCRFG